jgi:hypothetical protein
MQTTIENGYIVVRIPLQTPTPSSSGKTLIIASTAGAAKAGVQHNGQPVSVNVNAWIPGGAK